MSDPNLLDLVPVTRSDAAIFGERGYSFETLLGEGAYAKVWLVKYKPVENLQQTQLACKILDSKRAPRDFISKFLPREMDILSKISHPHLIHLHSIYQRKTKFFIFMRFAEKGDLLDYILANGEVKENQARLWTRQLSLGLQYLHNIEVVHRDIKCENVLITMKNNVKLADFGFSRFIVDCTGKRYLSSTYCGSLAYAAPELLKGKPYDPKRSDVWSLGIVLYIMLNQCMPFNDCDVKKLYELQMNRKWSFRSRIAAVLSEDAKNLVRKMLQPDSILRVQCNDVVSDHWFSQDDRLISMTLIEKEALEFGEQNKQEMIPKTQKLTIPNWKKRNKNEQIVCMTTLRSERSSTQFYFTQGEMQPTKTKPSVEEVGKRPDLVVKKSADRVIKSSDGGPRTSGKKEETSTVSEIHITPSRTDRSSTADMVGKHSTVAILPMTAEQNADLVPDGEKTEEPEVPNEENVLQTVDSPESIETNR